MQHTSHCVCAVCALQSSQGLSHEAALAQLSQRDAELIVKIGWVAHALVDQPLIHTHGLPERFDHPDLELRLDVPPRQRYELLAVLAEAVKAGRRFKPGDEDTTLFSVPVHFIAREESGRMVVRAIFPDPQGRFPDEPGCPSEWAAQLLQDAP